MNRITHYILIDRRVVECEDLMQWAKWMDLSRRDESFRVKQDFVADAWVSTVFLGLDHDFHFESKGPPIVFETLVSMLGRDDMSYSEVMQRYCTFEQAERGHEAIVDSLRVLESDAVEITRGMLNIVRMGVTSTMQQWRKDHE